MNEALTRLMYLPWLHGGDGGSVEVPRNKQARLCYPVEFDPSVEEEEDGDHDDERLDVIEALLRRARALEQRLQQVTTAGDAAPPVTHHPNRTGGTGPSAVTLGPEETPHSML